MQATAPEAVDLSQESEATKELYGLNRKETAEFGQRCLLARRLVERGVRFVQVYCGAGSAWDAHSDIEGNHTRMCARADQPTAALLTDLKRRGLLDSTLVVVTGDMGRTPKVNGKAGRDHWPQCGFCLFAGGGTKAGLVHGTTDKIAAFPNDHPVSAGDLVATVYHLVGVDSDSTVPDHTGRPQKDSVRSSTLTSTPIDADARDRVATKLAMIHTSRSHFLSCR